MSTGLTNHYVLVRLPTVYLEGISTNNQACRRGGIRLSALQEGVGKGMIRGVCRREDGRHTKAPLRGLVLCLC